MSKKAFVSLILINAVLWASVPAEARDLGQWDDKSAIAQ